MALTHQHSEPAGLSRAAWVRRTGVALAALALCCAGVDLDPRARAQTEGGAGFTIGDRTARDRPTRVLVISVQRLNRESKAGRSISNQAERLRTELLAEIEATQEILRTEERALADLKDTLPKDEFDARVAAFKTEWRSVRRAEQAALEKLQVALRAASAAFREARNGVLTDLMTRYDGAVMLDEASVVLSSNALNVTDEAIALLDDAAPRIEVRLAEDDN